MLFLSLLLGTAFALYFQDRRNTLNRLLALQLILIAIWQYTGFLHALLSAGPPLVRPLQIVAGVVAAYVFFVLGRHLGRLRAGKWEAAGAAWIFLIFIYYMVRILIPDSGNAAEFVLVDGRPVYGPTPAYVTYTSTLSAFYGVGIFHILKARRREEDTVMRKRMLLIVLTIGAAAMSGIIFINTFYILNIQMPFPIERVIMVSALLFLGYSVLGERAFSNENLIRLVREKEKAIRDRNRVIESELDLARMIHSRLFPDKPPRIPGYDIQGACISTDKVGGDFYDFYTRLENLGIFIADVSGHGIPAAFIASCTKMAFNYSAGHAENGTQLLKKMDVAIARRAVQSMYVTAVYAEIDYASRQLSYCTAGHGPILLHRRSDNTLQHLKAKGSPLGLMTGKPFEMRTLQLIPGDRLVFFTDGLTESINHERKPYTEERFHEFVRGSAESTAHQVTTNAILEILDYSGDRNLADDTTIVVVDVLEL
ncbi:MAG TPA: PP2C family protein-serine/threonine phosphatase [Leptospiraceae bacterium]|nr:PP2C family protein-serine/threonine phosphatase [Leptospirales bacterium]HMU83138.1 PP2C family protein-serine/threonine phosphatase [Leptospiraceae bacterium]HMX57677.1 PP2C family protein-serine/threonine phosphatase [Leptospiraceae bacterium]HNL69222.1 PP2C family protein-serine/threonine phosphatase [Leptospiraceae bacterium]